MLKTWGICSDDPDKDKCLSVSDNQNYCTVVRLLFFEVVGRDGSEISGEAREEVMAMGKEAFVQVKTRTKSFCFLFTTFYFSSQKLFGRPL